MAVAHMFNVYFQRHLVRSPVKCEGSPHLSIYSFYVLDEIHQENYHPSSETAHLQLTSSDQSGQPADHSTACGPGKVPGATLRSVIAVPTEGPVKSRAVDNAGVWHIASPVIHSL